MGSGHFGTLSLEMMLRGLQGTSQGSWDVFASHQTFAELWLWKVGKFHVSDSKSHHQFQYHVLHKSSWVPFMVSGVYVTCAVRPGTCPVRCPS